LQFQLARVQIKLMPLSETPKSDDLVLGGQEQPLSGSLVLGGIASLERDLVSPISSVRDAAIARATTYGLPGIKQLLSLLHQSSPEIQAKIYAQLKSRPEPFLPQALRQYCPYTHFQLQREISAESSLITDLAVSPDGRLIANAGISPFVKIWDLRSGRLRFTLADARPPLLIHPEGKLLITGNTSDSLSIWQLANGRFLRTIGGRYSGHQSEITAIALSQDGTLLATGGSAPASEVKLWHFDIGVLLYTFQGHRHDIATLSFGSEQVLVSHDRCGIINLWDIHQRRLRTQFHADQPMQTIALCPQGQALAGLDSTGQLHISFLADPTNTANAQVEVHTSTGVRTLAFSPNGRFLLCATCDRTLELRCAYTNQMLEQWTGPLDQVQVVRIASDRAIVTGSWDGLLHIWAPINRSVDEQSLSLS